MKIETEFSVGDKIFCFDGGGWISEAKITGIEFRTGFYGYEVEQEFPRDSGEFVEHFFRRENQIAKTKQELITKYS